MDNLRGSLLMTFAMLGFAVEDVLIKALSDRLPPGQIIASFGAGGAAVFLLWFALRRQPAFPPALGSPPALLRTGFEALGTVFFVSALALIPVTTASAVIQATPLVVAMGGALFLGQAVGWRRWAAILLGLLGVLLILRPGLAGFEPATLLAVVGMLGLAARDLVTRTIAGPLGAAHLSLVAFLALVPAGLLLCWITGAPLTAVGGADAGLLAAIVAVGLTAYLAIVAATRIGDVAVTSSFRYTRMVFALGLGFAVFGERPDGATLAGAAIVIAAGIYALIRETRASKGRAKPLYHGATAVSANIQSTRPKGTAP